MLSFLPSSSSSRWRRSFALSISCIAILRLHSCSKVFSISFCGGTTVYSGYWWHHLNLFPNVPRSSCMMQIKITLYLSKTSICFVSLFSLRLKWYLLKIKYNEIVVQKMIHIYDILYNKRWYMITYNIWRRHNLKYNEMIKVTRGLYYIFLRRYPPRQQRKTRQQEHFDSLHSERTENEIW